MKNTPIEPTVRQAFFAPLATALSRSTHTRSCPDYTDEQHLESGVGRVLDHSVSGREWIQRLAMKFGIPVSVSNSFAALRSKRRRNMVDEVARDVRSQADSLISLADDPLAKHQELTGFAVYASDGHTHGASAHEKERHGKKYPVTHLYSLNLRTHSLSTLGLSFPQADHRKKEHELATLKRLGGKALRLNQPKGVRVIHVYDPAIVDYIQWQKWKRGRGVYVLTLEKKNSALTKVGNCPWDKDDKRNIGVIADELVGPSNGYFMRRVIYQDPTTGKIYRFLLNELTIPPGLVAFLYKLRWDVEKVFDEIKNRSFERKAWAGNEPAKNQQAMFICLAHNLMRMLEIKLDHDEGITDQKAAAKRRTRISEEVSQADEAGRTPNPLVTTWRRATQRCCQFFRWLRHCIANSTPWTEAMDLLRPLMARYIQ